MFESLVIPLLFIKHYVASAQEQDAPVVTNGPQMELPWGWKFNNLAFWYALLLAGCSAVGILIGLFSATVTVLVAGPLGLLTGINASQLLLFIVGSYATPFGSVWARNFSEKVASPVAVAFHLGHGAPPFSAYGVGPGDPPATPVECGGLTMFISNRRLASSYLGTLRMLHDEWVAKGLKAVVWALVPLDTEDDPQLRESIGSQRENYQGREPRDGVILVVGARHWTLALTQALLTHGARDAVATDGSDSALIGSGEEIVMGNEGNPIESTYYRDPIQRYGLKMVPY